jgi:hypothetical protein
MNTATSAGFAPLLCTRTRYTHYVRGLPPMLSRGISLACYPSFSLAMNYHSWNTLPTIQYLILLHNWTSNLIGW